jgi:hypothetical protein
MRKTVIGGMALAAILALGGTLHAADQVAPGLSVGDVLGPENAEKAKDLLPPEIVDKYKKGAYRNPLVDYPPDGSHWEKSWIAATEKNATTLDVGDKGSIVDKTTGKPAKYVYGIPFPNIDPKDPRAADKIVWNQFLAYWHNGNTFNETMVLMLSPSGVDRKIGANGWFKFYDGQEEKYREENPLNLQSQFLGVAQFPADLQGTASLTWRYRDPEQHDSVWAFVPALRRVRQVSPTDRSDGYLGSDISGDDGFFFDGKPEDFTWTLVGKRDALRVVDPKSVSGTIEAKPAKNGGWTTLTDDNPKMLGYEDSNWKGVAWAPISAALAKRPMWVVRAKPKDRFYLYGEIELWIDAITWDGTWNRKFDWKGNLVHGYSTLARVHHPAGPPDDPEWVSVNTMVWACGENYKMDRASCSGMRVHPDSPYTSRVKIPASVFDSQSLVKYGK